MQFTTSYYLYFDSQGNYLPAKSYAPTQWTHCVQRRNYDLFGIMEQSTTVETISDIQFDVNTGEFHTSQTTPYFITLVDSGKIAQQRQRSVSGYITYVDYYGDISSISMGRKSDGTDFKTQIQDARESHVEPESWLVIKGTQADYEAMCSGDTEVQYDLYYFTVTFERADKGSSETISYQDSIINNNNYTTLTPTKTRICNVSADGTNYQFDTIYFKKYSNSTSVSFKVNAATSGNFITVDTKEKTGIENKFTFKCSANTDRARSGNIRFYDQSNAGALLEVIQINQSESEHDDDKDSTLPEDDNKKDEDTWWETNTVVSCVDDNTGSIVDSTSLLFKGNSTNIYRTIEQKDNTLFLGNYTPYSDVHIIQNLLNNSLSAQAIKSQEEVEYVGTNDFYTSNGQTYNYVPNMKLSSQERKLFKPGEEYMLGLVFLSSTGQRSNVWSIGTFSPKIEPYIDDNKLHKSRYKVTLSAESQAALTQKGIIAVMPVYALKTSYKILAQGFASPTITNTGRKANEGIDAQYSWYQRFSGTLGSVSSTAYNIGNNSDQEFQCPLEGNLDWTVNTKIWTMNTPEVEVSELLTNADLANSVLTLFKYNSPSGYINNVNITFNSSYLHSHIMSIQYPTTSRLAAAPLWQGYYDQGNYTYDSTDFTKSTGETSNYKTYWVFPWQRAKLGAEGEESKITQKRYFDSIFCTDQQKLTDTTKLDINDISIYRDYDTTQLLRLKDALYQGNIDYIINMGDSYYKLWTTDGGFAIANPKQDKSSFHAGYNGLGYCYDPISMKYKCAPHLVISLNTNYDIVGDQLPIMQLERNNYTYDTSESAMKTATWIKCGDQIVLNSSKDTDIYFDEGDYFYGRFDSLRTYPYAESDVNSITEIISGMLCSRINLDARTDRNRGISTPTVSPENFNKFNTAYDQLNNYFTYSWVNDSNESVYRSFHNTIQWSLTKTYGADIDDWCNIQDSNSLDLDGDKGELTVLKKFGNNIYAFQSSGVSQILYNEQMQLSSTEGVPIEIANSGKVNGKRYITDIQGCQNIFGVEITPSGMYFIDGINKTIYLMAQNGQLEDICATAGMKSWALDNINSSWRCYYDRYTQEILFLSSNSCIAWNDVFRNFASFLSYEGLYYYASLGARTYIFQNVGDNTHLWLKNAISKTNICGIYHESYLTIVANPQPTEDKIFSNIEFRADCFSSNDSYLPDNTFTHLRVWNEYQDTGLVPLSYKGQSIFRDDKGNYITSRDIPSNLKKRFRIWRINIPRSIYSVPDQDTQQQQVRIPIRRDLITNPVSTTDTIDYSELSKDISTLRAVKNRVSNWDQVTTASLIKLGMKKSRDRIRNPWAIVMLQFNNPNVDRIQVNDVMIQYYQ